MSAKHSKKGANKPASPTVRAGEPAPASAAAAAGAEASGAVAATADATPSWFDSTDPRKRMWGKIILVGVWIYVGALWLLALDQTFHWGIFGPKVPPIP